MGGRPAFVFLNDQMSIGTACPKRTDTGTARRDFTVHHGPHPLTQFRLNSERSFGKIDIRVAGLAMQRGGQFPVLNLQKDLN